MNPIPIILQRQRARRKRLLLILLLMMLHEEHQLHRLWHHHRPLSQGNPFNLERWTDFDAYKNVRFTEG